MHGITTWWINPTGLVRVQFAEQERNAGLDHGNKYLKVVWIP